MLAVTGGKGGVGKTTTALGVAAAQARDGRTPVVVDADLDVPDLANLAAVPADGLERVSRGEPLDAAPSIGGVTVLGATAHTALDDLRAVLDRLDREPHPVVVDCPAGVGAPHGIALQAASDALLVTRPTEPAVADALRTVTLARRLGATPIQVAVTGVRHVPPGFDTTHLPPAVAVPRPSRLPPLSGDLSSYDSLEFVR